MCYPTALATPQHPTVVARPRAEAAQLAALATSAVHAVHETLGLVSKRFPCERAARRFVPATTATGPAGRKCDLQRRRSRTPGYALRSDPAAASPPRVCSPLRPSAPLTAPCRVACASGCPNAAKAHREAAGSATPPRGPRSTARAPTTAQETAKAPHAPWLRRRGARTRPTVDHGGCHRLASTSGSASGKCRYGPKPPRCL
mmetsp:Transcript_10506/g.27828  ORF Transcript_10506/g.27828 Transcript_10506/m.27828 type:complete len:202 (+) Transcript_10506:488-1093(+)